MADYLHLALWIMAVALAGGYAGILYLRYHHRARDYPPEKQWRGHGIDVTGISDRVERVRHDYVTEWQSRPHAAGRRRNLLAMTSQAVGCLNYFRRRAPRNDVPTERDTESHAA
jgi:hypothetical protein